MQSIDSGKTPAEGKSVTLAVALARFDRGLSAALNDFYSLERRAKDIHVKNFSELSAKLGTAEPFATEALRLRREYGRALVENRRVLARNVKIQADLFEEAVKGEAV